MTGRENVKQGQLNPGALAVADLARLLSAAGGAAIDAAQIQGDVDAGAPTNDDGTLNLVQYAAWLVREMAARGAEGRHGD